MNDEFIKDTYDPLLSIKIEYLRDKLNKINVKLDKNKSRKNKLLICMISFGVTAFVCLVLSILFGAYAYYYISAITGITAIISYVLSFIFMYKFFNAYKKQDDLTNTKYEILDQIEIINRGFQFSSNIMRA